MKTRFTRNRWFESALLALTTLLLLATYSRGGLLITITVAGLTFLLVGRDLLKQIWTWFTSGFRSNYKDLFVRLTLVFTVIAIFAGAFLFLGRKNYFRRLWESSAESLSQYIVDINAGARSAYAIGALAAYEQYPLTGTGLGASGFYIYDNLPDWALTTVPEIARQLDPANKLFPNPKNIYMRLLAETGLIGFVLFIIFQFSVLGDALSFIRSSTSYPLQYPFTRFLAIAGLFAWLAITLYNATQDSLATPNIWLIPGIVAGMAGEGTARPQEHL
jgi:O-antigen ligase